MSLSGLLDELSQAQTKKKELGEQMDRLIPWEKWGEAISPCYYKRERGNIPYGIEWMLRPYVERRWYFALKRRAKSFPLFQPVRAKTRESSQGLNIQLVRGLEISMV